MTFSDGLSLILGIRDRNKLYEDETGALYAYEAAGRLVFETELYGEFSLSNFKHWRNVMLEIEDELLQRGITEYYAVVDSPKKFRWTQWLGMSTNMEVINNRFEVMVKRLNDNGG